MTDIFEVLEATWPPAQTWEQQGWRFRDGAGGGKRVSAATALSGHADLDALEQDAARRNVRALVQVQNGQDELDARLAQAGFDMVDRTLLWDIPVSELTDIPIPKVTAFAIWEPLAIMHEIWRKGGMADARFDVMGRAKCKTAILSRWNEKPAGAAFAAAHNGTCMVHAVEVLPWQRRQGVAQWMMRKAAYWAAEQGAHRLAVACVAGNTAANALYEGLGFHQVGSYHYRIKEGDT